jgi:hypothetical protein
MNGWFTLFVNHLGWEKHLGPVETIREAVNSGIICYKQNDKNRPFVYYGTSRQKDVE